MLVYNGLDDPTLTRTDRVLAVGAFDGVHRGHQRLLNHICRIAHEYGVQSSVMTFEPIPAQVFRPAGPNNVRLTIREERDRELSKHCLDAALVVDFDQRFRNITAVEFARDILVERLGVIALVASKTHSFGRNAEADVKRITELGMEFGFEVHVLPPILVDDRRINSTEVRRQLWAGDVETSNTWLGRPYELSGEVVEGRHVGRRLGYPTANVQPTPEKLVPGDGVYACAAYVDDGSGEPTDWVPAAVSIGPPSTFGIQERTIEAHLLADGNPDLVGRRLRLLFLARLRDVRTFHSPDALARQIARDVEQVRAEFKEHL